MRNYAGIDYPILTISTKELIEKCEDSFNLSTPADVETGQSDSKEEETFSDFIPLKKKKEMASDRYNKWENDNDFMFSDRVVP